MYKIASRWIFTSLFETQDKSLSTKLWFFCQILRVDSNSYSKSLLLQKPRCLLYLEKRLICLMIKTKINCKYLVISVFDLAAWSIHVRFNRWEYHFWKLMFGTCFYSFFLNLILLKTLIYRQWKKDFPYPLRDYKNLTWRWRDFDNVPQILTCVVPVPCFPPLLCCPYEVQEEWARERVLESFSVTGY